jgi:2-methylcitrate dehydratase PrpD
LASRINRRTALALLGAAVPLSIPREVFAAVSLEMTALSTYMGAAGANPLPPNVAENAKHHLLDTFASMISGTQLGPGQAAQRYIRTYGGKGACTIAGTRLTASPVDAALANAELAQADETDDSHNESHSHPGCAVVPAALAAGEEFGIDGARFLRAVTLGYDVGARVAIALFGTLGTFNPKSSLSTHAIAGTFGAAAAAACVAGLDARRMIWVLDYAAQQSSGIHAWQRDTEHIEKSFVFGGMPARNGVTAALLVQSGWTGLDDVFSGEDNFFAAYGPMAQPERLTEHLGERYEIVQTDIKKWTVGSPIQGALDAIVAIRGRRPFEASDVRSVTVRLAPAIATTVDNRNIPDICLQHIVAVMLIDGTLSFHAAHDVPRMNDPKVLEQRAKVMLVHDPELDKLMPVRVAVVEIVFADGTRLSERVTAVRGTPRNPMSRGEVIAKARDLTDGVIGQEKSQQLVETVYAIESLRDIRSLRKLLVAG